MAVRLIEATVALREADDDDHGVFCAGVWVSPIAILTAGHCVRHMRPDVDESPVGAVAAYQAHEGSPLSVGVVVAFDETNDLGLIVAMSHEGHLWARVSPAEPQQGDAIEVVGHPAGYRWSYVEGLVSGIRPDETNPRGDPMPTLQLAAPISGGNSGGGAFDSHGQLVGVCSYADAHLHGMGFFVDRSAIADFLRRSL